MGFRFGKAAEHKALASAGFLDGDALLVEVRLRVGQVSRPSAARQTDEYNGLKNQGATCYLNSLLQALYHTGAFRAAVYEIATPPDALPTSNIPLALQRLFLKLQLYRNKPVSTKELTKSFGWDTWDTFTQHDVQEMSRVLMDNLEGKTKGTKVDGALQRLFQGEAVNFIKCLHVPVESRRVEAFYDLSLNVKGCRDVYESFERYTETELLAKPNQYHAEGYGLQDAHKGVLFRTFPPVLHLQLKRFEYDVVRDGQAKLNDRYAFPTTLNLDKYLAPDAPRPTPALYELFGVLVHRGELARGHYYAFFKLPSSAEGGQRWYRFDDSRVSLVPETEAVDDNFGGANETVVHGKKVLSERSANAYMLVYLRASQRAQLIAPAAVPSGLMASFDAFLAAKKRRKQEKAEAHLYMHIKVATELDLARHRDFDLANFAHVRSFRVRRDSTLAQFKRRLAVHIGVPPERQRLWVWLSRQNKTYRPDWPFTFDDELKPLAEARPRDFFLEIARRPPLPVGAGGLVEGDWRAYFPEHREDALLLFFKFYDHAKCRMEYAGFHTVPLHSRVADLLPVLCRLRGLPLGTPLQLFEEVRPSMVNSLRPHMTLHQEELTNGDIIIFQRPASVAEAAKTNWPDVVQFCSYLHTRIQITFLPLPAAAASGHDRPVQLELNQKMFHDQVTARLAEALHLAQPLRIRLYAYSYTLDGPAATPLRRDDKTELAELASLRAGAPSATLYFEVLDFAVTELEHKRQFRVAWQTPRTDIAGLHSVLVPRDATVAALIEAVKAAVPPPSAPPTPQTPANANHSPSSAPPSASSVTAVGERRVRLFEVTSGARIERVLRDDAPLTSLPEQSFTRLHAEECAPEEAALRLKDGDRLIRCVHVSREDFAQLHGNPFVTFARKHETLADVKRRIQARLGVADDAFKAWRFFLYTPSSAYRRERAPLADDWEVARHAWEVDECLGLEHDAGRRAAHAYSNRRGERAVKING